MKLKRIKQKSLKTKSLNTDGVLVINEEIFMVQM